VGDEAPGEGAPGEALEKLMAITREEFETGLRRLTGSVLQATIAGHYVLADIGAGRQSVRCSFERLPDAVLGGLMKLPRARIRLHLADLPREAREDFIASFDRIFQRGGG